MNDKPITAQELAKITLPLEYQQDEILLKYCIICFREALRMHNIGQYVNAFPTPRAGLCREHSGIGTLRVVISKSVKAVFIKRAKKGEKHAHIARDMGYYPATVNRIVRESARGM